MRVFCELRSILYNTSNEQNAHSYYMLSHRIRGLLFHYKKNCYFAIGLYSVSVFSNKIVNVFIVELSNFCLFCLFSSFFFVQLGPKDPNKSKLGSSPVSHNCFFIRRYSPCCKPVKLGHYRVLQPRILRLLLTLYGKIK